MNRFWIVCFWILSSVALFSRVTEVSVLPYQNDPLEVVVDASMVSGASLAVLAPTYDLEELVKHTSYQIPTNPVVSGNERSCSGNQRRHIQLDREVKDLHAYNNNSRCSVVSYKLSGGDYLNVSAPKQFFIYALHRIRV